MKSAARFLFTLTSFLPFTAWASTVPTRMICYELDPIVKCNQKTGQCSAPPPLALLEIGTVPLAITSGQGFSEGKGTLSHIFKVGTRSLTFTAMGQYFVNSDGSNLSSSFSLTFLDNDSLLTIGNGGGPDISALASTKPDTQGDYFKENLWITCGLN